MAYWLDYSAAKLSGPVIRAAGYTGVIRYIDAPQLLGTKHTNADEYRSHLAAGLTVRLVHQGNTRDADSGWQGGVNRATRAKAGADMLGYTGVIYFTNDRTTVPDVAAWRAYLDGAASVLGRERVGAYGFYNALNAAVGHASAFWQAGRRSDLVPHANFWQDNNTQVRVGGITCDRNLVIADYVPRGAVPPAPPKPADDEDDEMSYYPKLQGDSLNPKADNVAMDTLPWDGREAVLHIIPTGAIVFMGKPLCWGPGTGKDQGNGRGGGDSTVPGVNPSRVEVNQPGQYRIPAGTTRVFYSYSCAQPHFAWIKAV